MRRPSCVPRLLTCTQISQMEIEIQGIPQSLRPQYQNRHRTAKADLTRFKKTSKDMHAQFSRADLLASPGRAGTPTSDEPYGATSDRTRLLAGTATLEDGTRRLQESQRIALETEDHGAEILVNLRTQREQIENARDTVGDNFAELWVCYSLSPSYGLQTRPSTARRGR